MAEANKELGSNIKAILNSRGIKSMWLAEKSGMPREALSRIINGKRIVNAVELVNIAKALNMSVEEVVNYGKANS